MAKIVESFYTKYYFCFIYISMTYIGIKFINYMQMAFYTLHEFIRTSSLLKVYHCLFSDRRALRRVVRYLPQL